MQLTNSGVFQSFIDSFAPMTRRAFFPDLPWKLNEACFESPFSWFYIISLLQRHQRYHCYPLRFLKSSCEFCTKRNAKKQKERKEKRKRVCWTKTAEPGSLKPGKATMVSTHEFALKSRALKDVKRKKWEGTPRRIALYKHLLGQLVAAAR